MIAGYIQTVRESKKKGTNIFSTLVLVVYCHRQYCSDCNVEFHSVEDRELHVGHATNLRYGDTFCLRSCRLEAFQLIRGAADIQNRFCNYTSGSNYPAYLTVVIIPKSKNPR